MNNNSNDKNITEEEYLLKHLNSLQDLDSNKNFNEDIITPVNVNHRENTVSNNDYFAYDIMELPCGIYYPNGTSFMIKSATVKDIQAYSMVDNSNFYDVVNKMNDILMNCCRIKYQDGTIKSFNHLKDPDRIYVIFAIREMTFQKGNSLAAKAKCDKCKIEVEIELRRSNFVFNEPDKGLSKYFNEQTRSYQFKLKNNKVYEMAPPTIGIQRSFTDYITKKVTEKKEAPSLSFLKIMPFLLPNRDNITNEGIEAKLKEYENLDDMSFQFLNAAVDKMKLGIKELKSICQCGSEVHTGMQFPSGASAIFVIPDAFESYIIE